MPLSGARLKGTLAADIQTQLAAAFPGAANLLAAQGSFATAVAAAAGPDIVTEVLNAVLPPGTILPFAGTTAPGGYLLCNGQAISRTTYSVLFAVLSTTFGAGDGSTTFNVPNLQGIFPSGAGSQTVSSVTYSRTLGTVQGDQMQGHGHNFNRDSTLSAGGSGLYNVYSGNTIVGMTTGIVTTPTTDGTNGTPRVGAETRPANLALNYLIATGAAGSLS